MLAILDGDYQPNVDDSTEVLEQQFEKDFNVALNDMKDILAIAKYRYNEIIIETWLSTLESRLQTFYV